MSAEPPTTTFLFTDIEGSTRLWEREPERMRVALARHDAVCQAAVQAQRGRVVKGTGDGIHAVFDDPLDGVLAALELQRRLAVVPSDQALNLRVRCGLHAGVVECRDGDFFGSTVNRAARVMSIAHGGQTLLSQAVAEQVAGRLPADVTLQNLGSVRLRDLSGSERVHQLQHPELRAQFPPLRSLEATPNNLAQQLDSFIGREQERAELRQQLGRTRLLTLLGMGGIGKSRLSVQLGAELLDEYPDGVWLVELAPLTDARLVPQALASVLGVKEQPGQAVVDALLAYVRDKTLLVILDNCEHVVRACADLAKQLLQAAAGVKVLASSRDVLQVAGESTYPVPTLGVPDSNQTLNLGALAQHESVRLFVDRASAAQASFRLTADNAAAVANICQRLDGIPLALELAAARTRALSAQAIAARLNDRFKLLVTGDQTVLPRQRTLRALIDWSFDLLSEPERTLFRRLAVFAGGWTLEAAEAVGGGDGIDALDVLDLLALLVSKSLVVMEAGGGRYRMLETVRAYAQEKLVASDEEAPTRARHLATFLELSEVARARLAGPDQGSWLTRLDGERENLLQAHAWCDRAGAADDGLRLVYALRRYWVNRGLLGLGLQVTLEALARPGAEAPGLPRFNGLMDAGWLAYFMGRYDQARAPLTEALDLARNADHNDWAARALQPLGMACLGAGDVQAAQAYLQEAVAMAKRLGNTRELAAAINSLAQLHRLQGQMETAEPLYGQALDLARQLGDQEYCAAFLLNLTMVSMDHRPARRIKELLADVLAIVEDIGSKPAAQSMLEVCSGLAAARSDWLHCALFYGSAEATAQQTGLRRDAADEAFLLPRIEAARLALGQQPFEAAEAQGRTMPPAQTLPLVKRWLDGID